MRKKVLRDGRQRAVWVALRKGVAYLFRCREISLQANARYLDAWPRSTIRRRASRRCRKQCRWRNTTPRCSRA